MIDVFLISDGVEHKTFESNFRNASDLSTKGRRLRIFRGVDSSAWIFNKNKKTESGPEEIHGIFPPGICFVHFFPSGFLAFLKVFYRVLSKKA